MTYRSISSSDLFSREQREEMRFLRAIKGVLREEITRRMELEGLTQEQLAVRAGMDPAQMSRVLSPDAHVSTRTLFRIAYALDRRWAFELVEMSARRPSANAPLNPSAVTHVGQDATASPLPTSINGSGAVRIETVRKGLVAA